MGLDTALTKASHAAVEPNGTLVIEHFYDHLFEHNPDVRLLFADHPDEQQDRLWAALGVLVSNIDDLDTAVPIPQGFSSRHVGCGAFAEHCPAVGASLLAALEHFAGETRTPDIASARIELHGVIPNTTIGAAVVGVETGVLPDPLVGRTKATIARAESRRNPLLTARLADSKTYWREEWRVDEGGTETARGSPLWSPTWNSTDC
jgi:hemoglobin-like flavoprotein